MFHTQNNIIRSLLFQAHLPPTCWVESLHMVAHLLNILSSTTPKHDTPFHKVVHKQLSYAHLRVFGCHCYPYINNTNKEAPDIMLISLTIAWWSFGFSFWRINIKYGHSAHRNVWAINRCFNHVIIHVFISIMVLFNHIENFFFFSSNSGHLLEAWDLKLKEYKFVKLEEAIDWMKNISI